MKCERLVVKEPPRRGDRQSLGFVTDWNSNSTTYAYDDAGRMTTTTLPSGTGIVSTYTYDAADRLTNIAHVKGGSTTVASVDYTLDDVGNRTQRVDQQGTHTYAYDDLYRLTSVTYPGPSTMTYDFDAFGNRTEMDVSGNATTYAYDDADRISTVTPPSPASAISYTWDDNGNLTDRGSDSFDWDYEDRMVSATVNSVTTTFAYRGDGLRDSRTVGMSTTTFTWDIAGGLPVVLDDGNQYVYGAGLTAQKQSGSWYYYLADGLGSTMAIVDASGNSQKSYEYDVYGEVAGGSGSLGNEFDFAGQQTDGTGLQYLRARYYDPATGTFLTREPMAKRPTWLGSSSGYANGSPARFNDPTGQIPTDACEPDCGSAIYYGDEFGLGADGMWLEQYLDKNGKLNVHACGFKTAGGPEITGVECSSGIFDGGFDIFIGEKCSLSFDAKEQNFALACHRPGSDAAPENPRHGTCRCAKWLQPG
ncbi:MAG: RHS repeat domain-containing protein [Dehalococcoidia bacterium]